MMDTVVAPPSHVTMADLGAWLARHDVELKDVKRLEIVTERRPEGRLFLRVERYLRGEDGIRFSVFEDGEHVVAMEQLLIPIHDLP